LKNITYAEHSSFFGIAQAVILNFFQSVRNETNCVKPVRWSVFFVACYLILLFFDGIKKRFNPPKASSF